jgi:hypothetical protein
MVAAFDMPRCSMKVIEASCSAIPCAASSRVPIQPIITFEPTNSPPSATMVRPMGRPSQKTALNSAQSARQKRWNR